MKKNKYIALCLITGAKGVGVKFAWQRKENLLLCGCSSLVIQMEELHN